MTKTALILHGTMGSPAGNWFPWLTSELQGKGWEVSLPTLPTPSNQSLENWHKAIESSVTNLNDIDVLVGHSLGATMALRLLEAQKTKPQSTFLISPVTKKINISEYDQLNKSFIDNGFDYQKIKSMTASITIYHGSNDPYVPIDHAKELSQNLTVDLDIINGGKHLNTDSGYTKFDILLNDILN